MSGMSTKLCAYFSMLFFTLNLSVKGKSSVWQSKMTDHAKCSVALVGCEGLQDIATDSLGHSVEVLLSLDSKVLGVEDDLNGLDYSKGQRARDPVN